MKTNGCSLQDYLLQGVAGGLDAFDKVGYAVAADSPTVEVVFVGFSDFRGPDGPDIVASGSAVSVKDGSGKHVLPVGVSEAGHGEFAQLTKCFQFTKGLPDERYVGVLSSMSNNRPANCVDLAVVTVNQMV